MHLKRYHTKLGYKYMILEAGTNWCLVNLGCVNPREAQAELRNWLTDTKRQQAIAKFRLHDDTLLVTDYRKQYVERYLPAKAQKTIISELEAITKFKAFFTGIPLGRLTKADLQRYINWRLAARHSRRGTPLSPSSINLELRYLKHILNCAVDDELVDASPFKRSLKLLPVDKPSMSALSHTEFEHLYDAAPLHLKGILLCGAKLGLRPGEILQIQFDDIDLERKILAVVSQGQRRTKNRQSRVVLLTDDLVQYFALMREWWPTLSNTGYLPRSPRQRVSVFCHEDGTPFKSFKRSFNRAKTIIGLLHLVPKDLRKTFACWLADMDIHPEKVRRLSGHSDIRVLLDHYTHVEVMRMRESVNASPNCVSWRLLRHRSP
jgi:integrase